MCCTLATATIVTSNLPDGTDGDNDASNIIMEAMTTTTRKNIMAEVSDAAAATDTDTDTASSTSAAATGSIPYTVAMQDADLDADLYDENENVIHKDEQEIQYTHTYDDHTNQSHQYTATAEHGHWGTPHSKSGSITHPSSTAGTTTTTTTGTGNNAPHSHMHIHTHKPPDAFKLAARIKHKGTKSKSYFQFETIQDPLPSIPFLECNSVGTTTPPIPANNISFRSFPKSAHPSSYTHTRGFIVPLTKIEIEVEVEVQAPGDIHNSRRIFHAGEIIWVDGMYRMSSAEEGDLSVLIVNVPKEGKSRDLFGIPLKVNIDMMNMNCNNEAGMWGRGEEDSNLSSMVKDVQGSVSLRRAVLGTVGVGLSSLMTYFWIKVAPLQLAVGIGGVCMVSGGTLALVLGGEFICDQLHEYVVNVREDRDNLEASDEEERGGLDGAGDEEEDNNK